MPKALPNTLLTSFCTSLALHAVFIEIFPTKPISASSLRFSPRGIWMGIVRECGRQTMSFAYILFFAAGVDDRRRLTLGCGATAELHAADGKGNIRV